MFPYINILEKKAGRNMAVKNILDSIENLVVESRRMPLMNKSLIDESDLIHLVDELRRELPLELQKAERVMQERQEILDRANDEAAALIEKAKKYAAELVDKNEIVMQAEEKAKAIMQQTKEQEREIMEKTMANAKQLRDDADQYANQVFDHLIGNLGNALQVVQQAKDDLNHGSRG